MRALVASPNSPERIELRNVPDPVPRSDESLVRVRAISLNRGEAHRLQAAKDGDRLGWDLAGVIETTAADGSGLPNGTRVVGIIGSAGWSEIVAVSSMRLAAIPDKLSFAAAAALPVAAITALRMLRIAGLLLGKRVLVTGAAGGVGRFVVQLAKQAGAEVTGITRDQERAQGLHDLGADNVIHDIEAAEGNFDLILESVGGASLAAAITHVAPAGAVVTFGNSSLETTTFNVSDFYGRNTARIEGFSLLSPLQFQDFRPDLTFLAQETATGRLDPQIGYQNNWSQAAEALRALRDRRVQGKAILEVD